jgi:hypothetical protein
MRLYLLSTSAANGARAWTPESAARAADLLRRIPLRALTGPPALQHLVEDLANRLGLPAEPPLGDLEPQRVDRWLSALASRYPAEEPCALLPPWAIGEILAGVLGTATARFGALEACSLCAIEWPVGEDARARLPSLAGLDLDWLPPRAGGERERFPSGPSGSGTA